MVSNAITISCEGNPAPGASWSIDVEFRPLKRGFAVWVYENNLMTDRPKKRRAGGSTKELTWRTAYEYLSGDETPHVFGDFWFETTVGGLPIWAADILRCVFIVDDDGQYNYRAIGDLLVGFTDDEIQTIVPIKGGSFEFRVG